MAEAKKYDAGDPEAVAEKKASAKASAGARTDGLRQIMNSPNGRAWMWHLLEICHPFTTSCLAFSAQVYFLEGERNVGLQVLADIQKKFPDQYLTMIKENQEKSNG